MRFTVCIPATTANLGLGSDCIGLVVSWFDGLTLEVSDTGGTSIEVTGEDVHQVPRDKSHPMVATLLHALRQWGVAPPDGLVLRVHDTIPHSRGSSPPATAMVTGCVFAHGIAFPDKELNRAELIRISGLFEGHLDNADAAV